MSKPWLCLVLGLFFGSLASNVYNIYDGFSDAENFQAGLKDPQPIEESVILSSSMSVQKKATTASPFGNERLASFSSRPSTKPEVVALEKRNSDTTTLAPKGKDNGATHIVASGSAQDASDPVAVPEIDDRQQAALDLELAEAQIADQQQQALDDERILAEISRIELEHPVYPAVEEKVVLSEAELEYQRVELDKQIEEEAAAQVESEGSLTSELEGQPEPLLPEQN